MTGKKITCNDCGAGFTLTVGEQRFIREKGLGKEPVRCPDCRKARNILRNSTEYIYLMRQSKDKIS